ncbi:hypothetical protein GGS20DRAFT_555898 [Poronia punctata]|nr:hypothetical protein GGS20DRAFT_555898 [Poronia punctata]
MMIKSLLLTALATLGTGQYIDPTFIGDGEIYVVQGDAWPWGPSNPEDSTLGCLNSAGKLVASGCGVFEANLTTIYSTATDGECGWTIRAGAGGQPGVFNCANPVNKGLYRLNGRLDEPDYIAYGAGYMGWSTDGLGSGSAVDIYNGANWGPINVVLQFKFL